MKNIYTPADIEHLGLGGIAQCQYLGCNLFANGSHESGAAPHP